MHDFTNNFRAIAISYASTDAELMIYEPQRKVFEYFCKYIFAGACFKKDSMRWMICKYWGYTNTEIQNKYEEKYHRRMSLSSIAATKTAVNDMLNKLLGEDFFDYFCEFDSEIEAYEAARKAVSRINAVKNMNKKCNDMFIDDITDIYYENTMGAVKVYNIADMKNEIELLARLSKNQIKMQIENVDMRKISYILFMIDGFSTKDEKVNESKLEILEAIEDVKSKMNI